MSEKVIHILVVEDERSHAELIERVFKDCGDRIELTVACNLREAHRYLAESSPDLLITDLVLPDGKGTDLRPGASKDKLP